MWRTSTHMETSIGDFIRSCAHDGPIRHKVSEAHEGHEAFSCGLAETHEEPRNIHDWTQRRPGITINARHADSAHAFAPLTASVQRMSVLSDIPVSTASELSAGDPDAFPARYAARRSPCRQARQASPNARKSASRSGKSANRHSGCHCTPSTNPGAAGAPTASIVPSSA